MTGNVCAVEVSRQLLSHRHHCFKSGNIPKTEGDQIHLNFVTVYDPNEIQLTQKGGYVVV